jgi:hypothetical protein
MQINNVNFLKDIDFLQLTLTELFYLFLSRRQAWYKFVRKFNTAIYNKHKFLCGCAEKKYFVKPF